MAQKYGVPLIIEKFIKKIENIGSKYVFAVSTCGGWELVNALPTLKQLKKIINKKGGKLTGEFSIKLPMNNLTYPYKFISQDREKMFKDCKIKIDEISYRVLNRKRNSYQLLKTFFNILMMPLYKAVENLYVIHLRKMAKEPENTKLTYFELIPLSDKSILVEDNCNGCGTRVKV